MNELTNTRRAIIEITYLGVKITKDIAPYLVGFTYNDNEGRLDEIQIELEDRDRKWQKPWLPKKDDEIQATIKLINWKKEGVVTQLNCGTFYIDDVSFKGPPDRVSIKALSLPLKAGGKNTKNSRTWENTTLRKVLEDLAASSGLTLLYDASEYVYDRVEQIRKTDLSFAKELAKREGLATKITDKQLVVYDESFYEKKKTLRRVKRGEHDVKNYDFKESLVDKQYKKIQIMYKDGTKKQSKKYVYDVPGVTEGPTLKLKKNSKLFSRSYEMGKS